MIKISDIAIYLPEKIIEFQEYKKLKPEWDWNKIIKATGVERVREAANDEFAVDMGRKAAEKLFKKKNIDKAEIDYLVFSSLNNHFTVPAPVYLLQHQLGLSENIGVNYFKLGCTGFLHTLMVSQGLFVNNLASKVLFVGSTAVRKYLHPNSSGTIPLFGDIGVAVLIEKDESKPKLPFVFGTDGGKYKEIIIKDGNEAFRYSDSSYVERRDNYGNVYSDATLYMNPLVIFNASYTKTKKMIDDLIEKYHVDFDAIDKFVFHQSSLLTLTSLQKRLKIPKEKMLFAMKNYGNTVESTIPITIFEAEKNNNIKRRDKLFLSAFGIGFSWISTVIEY